MSNLIQVDDFKGNYYVAINKNAENHFQEILDSQEKIYLTNLLGIELRDLFIADLVNGVPQNAEYLEFYNEFQELICGEMLYSKGLKKVLLGLVFNDFVSSDNFSHSLTGVIISSNENSEVVTQAQTVRFAEDKRNNIVESYNLISKKIKELGLYDYSYFIDYTYLDLV